MSYPPNPGLLVNHLRAVTPHWVVRITKQRVLMHLAMPGTEETINETQFKLRLAVFDSYPVTLTCSTLP